MNLNIIFVYFITYYKFNISLILNKNRIDRWTNSYDSGNYGRIYFFI